MWGLKERVWETGGGREAQSELEFQRCQTTFGGGGKGLYEKKITPRDQIAERPRRREKRAVLDGKKPSWRTQREKEESYPIS